MKIPLITTNSEIVGTVTEAVARMKEESPPDGAPGSNTKRLELVTLSDPYQSVEFINYQMPPLILIAFSKASNTGFEIMDRIAADPWLNHGGIIAIYEEMELLARINELSNTNIIISLHNSEVERQLPTVMNIILENQHFLFQRALQTDLVSSISGNFVLDLDLRLVPCYANLIANYLFNVGFLDSESKMGLSLALTELLTNAIEHGNCEIDAKAKTAYLEHHSTIQDLIKEKCTDPKVAARKVYFNYQIDRERSKYLIRDEGKGFPWRKFVSDTPDIDQLSNHGRGIFLSNQVAEAINYNEQGNEVEVVYAHHGQKSEIIPSVLSKSEVVEFQPGDVVFNQGEESDFLYYVAEGVYRVEVNGRHVNNVSPEDILVGEMSFLLEEARSATMIANTPGRLIKISKEDFINIIQNQPYYGLFLSKLIARRLQRQNQVLGS